ncbi:molybdenum cofactor biosynthesis protein MoaE [Chitinophaga sp. SYP-B3965]|uniref:molybdenum cofactor biosynthesis protein MoaE n=1 Tax=Chitinophaga sp. SYP-B3965 TaxID=2663120 RepID=UPI001299A3ED|nr:molybdenum cofactor biosynthesis protein MoaE [Chitinophaga sp. SYP-B3965]MRG45860.1 molybdenum cofactor biosynthesis protein MoaE [Chitinophaga sp. SYP-B3965]
MEQLIRISDNIDAAEAVAFVQSEESGGVVTFIGSVRNQTKQKKVLKLVFECYEPMAILEMEKIAAQMYEKWQVKRVAMLHVTGEKLPGEVVVAIAVAAPHRGAAFEACQYAIDTLKETVPIWKQEFFEDGAVWVAAHP